MLSQLEAALRRDTRIYHPEWNRFTGSPNATLILGQVSYWWNKGWERHKPRSRFFKENKDFQQELGLSRKQFLHARKSLGRQVAIGENETHQTVFDEGHLIAWYTDQAHKTWYYLNESLLDSKLAYVYELDPNPPPDEAKSRIPKGDSGSSRIPKGDSESPERGFGYTKTTTEITEEEEEEENNSKPCNPVRVDIDDNGDPVPHKFDKHDPFVKSILRCLWGFPPYNLQGRWRAAFEEHILSRARRDDDWRRWCLWQAQNNAKNKRLTTYIEFVISEREGATFEDWLRGDFIARDEWEKNGKYLKKPDSRRNREENEAASFDDEGPELTIENPKEEFVF